MKHTLPLGGLLLICLLSFNGLYAQKVGHVHIGKLLTELPEYQEAQKELEAFATVFADSIKQKEQKYFLEFTQFQQNLNQGLISKVRQDSMLVRFQGIEAGIEEKKRQAQQKIGEKEQALFTPIREAVYNAMQAVIKEEEYAYVFDLGKGGILTGPTSDDISEKILAKMKE